jgi:hypothetical protein
MEKIQRAKDARKNYGRDHPDVAPEVAEAVASQKIMMGMTPDQVRTSWGEPKSVTRSVSSLGTLEMWWYSGACLDFANGKLESWTTDEAK